MKQYRILITDEALNDMESIYEYIAEELLSLIHIQMCIRDRAYADRGNTRMRSKYYRMIRHGKKDNVAVAAVARELACFIWGLMTNNITPKEEGTKAA